MSMAKLGCVRVEPDNADTDVPTLSYLTDDIKEKTPKASEVFSCEYLGEIGQRRLEGLHLYEPSGLPGVRT